MHKQQRGSVIVLPLLVIALVAIGFVGWKLHQANQKLAGSSASASAPAPQSLSLKGTQIVASDYYEIQFTAQQVYYAKVQPIDANYVRLTPVFYATQQSGGAYTLIALGNEIQAPVPVMYARKAAISAVTKLTSDGQIYKAIANYVKTNKIATIHDGYPATNINAYTNSSKYKAFFFADGTAYYANLSSVHDLPFKASDTVYTITGSSQSPTLQKVTSAQLPTDSEDKLLFWENLEPSGQVVQGINKHEAE